MERIKSRSKKKYFKKGVNVIPVFASEPYRREFLVGIKGKTIGKVLIETNSEKKEWQIKSFYPAQAGGRVRAGIGTNVMRIIINQARAEGVSQLHVGSWSTKGQFLYNSMGFKETPRGLTLKLDRMKESDLDIRGLYKKQYAALKKQKR